MVENFHSTCVHAEPESDQQVELEEALPLLSPLEDANALDSCSFVSDVYLTEGLRLQVIRFDHFIDYCFLLHAYEDRDVYQLLDCGRNLAHLLVCD